MEIDKSQAVAIAAFSRFDDDVHDPVLRAVSAAYCLVACADGELEASEIAEYVRQLEEAKDTAELPEASGEAIAREFERYLRRRGGDTPR